MTLTIDVKRHFQTKSLGLVYETPLEEWFPIKLKIRSNSSMLSLHLAVWDSYFISDWCIMYHNVSYNLFLSVHCGWCLNYMGKVGLQFDLFPPLAFYYNGTFIVHHRLPTSYAYLRFLKWATHRLVRRWVTKAASSTSQELFPRTTSRPGPWWTSSSTSTGLLSALSIRKEIMVRGPIVDFIGV